MRTLRSSSFGLLLVGLLACKSSQREVDPVEHLPLPVRVTGANLRPVGDARRAYGSDKAEETMTRLRGLGVNTVSLLLEGRMQDLRDTTVRKPSEDRKESLREALRDARRLGLATIVIPHVYLDDGSWRGHIDPEDPTTEDAWWSSYGDFIVEAARVSEQGSATLLSIGVELKALSSKPSTRPRIQALVDRVREVYSGLITYSANWDEGESVVFWDLVDLAGVNGYYPLVPDPVRGAESVARRLTALADIAGREVLVLEVGYRAGPGSHVRPWEWPEQHPEDDVDANAQASAWAAILPQWLNAPGVRGLCVWVIPTDPDDPASEPAHGFNPLNRPAEQVIQRAFSQASASPS